MRGTLELSELLLVDEGLLVREFPKRVVVYEGFRDCHVVWEVLVVHTVEDIVIPEAALELAAIALQVCWEWFMLWK